MVMNGLIYMTLLILFEALLEDIDKIWFECNSIENIKIKK